MKRVTVLFSVLWGVIGVLGLAGPSVLGADIWWDVCNGDWSDAANWIPSRLPAAADTVYIDNGCGGPSITKGNMYGGIVYVGFDLTKNTLTQSGFVPNQLSVTDLYIGRGAGSSGTYSLSGTGIIKARNLYVGFEGEGAFIQNGGKITSDQIYLAFNPISGRGSYLLQNGEIVGGIGTSSILLGSNSGTGGQGTFRQTGGTVNMRIQIYGTDCLYKLDNGTINALDISYGAATNIRGWSEGHISKFIQRGGTNTTNGLAISTRSNCPECAGNYTLEGGSLSVNTGIYGYEGNISIAGPLCSFIQSGGTNTVTRDVIVEGGAAYELSGTGVLSMTNLQLGTLSNSGRFIQRSGVNTVQGNLCLGQACGSLGGGPTMGRYELSGDGQLTVQGSEIVGQDPFAPQRNPDSRGDFVQTGGSHVVQSFLYLGNDQDITGTYTLSDGELEANILWIGNKGNGEFMQTGGTTSTGRLDIARDTGSTGEYILDQTGQLLVDERITVGRSGQGAMEIKGGKVATKSFSIGRYIGRGALSVTPDAEVVVTQELVLGAKASFGAEPGSRIFMKFDTETNSAASFQNLSQDPFQLSGLSNLELCFQGGAALTATMEIAGNDVGVEEMGFLSNFALGMLRVGTDLSPAQVKLVDDTDNGTGGPGLEVLYVDRIVVSSGSILDVNGRLVYYHTLCNSGGTIELNGGSLIQVGIPGDLDHDGDVDIDDLTGLIADWLWEGLDGGIPADLACGGDVDMLDFAILASHWLEQGI